MSNHAGDRGGDALDTSIVAVPADRGDARWKLIRDVALFQVKLVADGLRDLVLSPLSLAAGVLGLVFGGSRPDGLFQSLLVFGRHTEKWIDLFGANRYDRNSDAEPSLDGLADRIEDLIRNDMENGGVTANTRRRVDEMLDRMGEQRRARRRHGRHGDEFGPDQS